MKIDEAPLCWQYVPIIALESWCKVWCRLSKINFFSPYLLVLQMSFLEFAYTHYWLVVLIYLLTFWNSIMKLISFLNFCWILYALYPKKFIDKCIIKFLNNIFIQKSQIPTVPKKELIIILLYLDKMSCIVKTRLTKTMNKHMKFCTLWVISKLMIHLQTTFTSKILFLKHYGKVWFINFHAEAAKPPILVRSIDTSK